MGLILKSACRLSLKNKNGPIQIELGGVAHDWQAQKYDCSKVCEGAAFLGG